MMKLAIFILLFIAIAFCLAPPLWPAQYSTDVTEIYGREHRRGQWFYDQRLGVDRIDTEIPEENVKITEIFRYDLGRRYLIRTPARGPETCEVSHLEGKLPYYNFSNYEYRGRVVFDGEDTDRWDFHSFAFTFIYYDTIGSNIPVARVREPREGLDEEIHYTNFTLGPQSPNLFNATLISSSCNRPIKSRSHRAYPNLFSKSRKAVGCSAESCSYMQGLVANYFSSSYQDDMICIAYYESSWCPAVYNGICCYGLWQISYLHLGESGCPSSVSDLYDPDTNAQCAVTVLGEQGLNAWQTWTEGDCRGWNQC
jgi:hypothetical protein